jgi:hypothetical protein
MSSNLALNADRPTAVPYPAVEPTRWLMKLRALMVLAPTLFASLALFGAEEPPNAPPSRIVGSIFGKPVTAADIGLTTPINPAVRFDSRDADRWELMGRIMTTFGDPIVDRFVNRQKIEATVDEIEKFQSNSRKSNEREVREWEARLLELKKELAAPSLSNADKAKLEEERAMLQRYMAASRELGTVPEDLARMFIVAWKTERELQRVYGGRVMFQQAGPEALDARRQLFEQAEKDGDVTFGDAGVRHLFYYYANMRHTVIDEKALERPWFLDEAK